MLRVFLANDLVRAELEIRSEANVNVRRFLLVVFLNSSVETKVETCIHPPMLVVGCVLRFPHYVVMGRILTLSVRINPPKLNSLNVSLHLRILGTINVRLRLFP